LNEAGSGWVIGLRDLDEISRFSAAVKQGIDV
jgi:hypothetical protein